jgi:hypothetical protein
MHPVTGYGVGLYYIPLTRVPSRMHSQGASHEGFVRHPRQVQGQAFRPGFPTHWLSGARGSGSSLRQK